MSEPRPCLSVRPLTSPIAAKRKSNCLLSFLCNRKRLGCVQLHIQLITHTFRLLLWKQKRGKKKKKQRLGLLSSQTEA